MKRRRQQGCPCEGCKETRRQAQERRAGAKAARAQRAHIAALKAAQDSLTPLQKNHMRIGKHVASVCEAHLDKTWTSQDGRTVPLLDMGMAHLLFAAAKMEREGRHGPFRMLSSEILRRLAHAYCPQSFREPNEQGNYRDGQGASL
jgi:hypothetical protein